VANDKLRLYFDTTIPNYLFVDDRAGEREATWLLWGRCAAGEYEVSLSDIFFEEIERCPQPKLRMMREQLGLIDFEHLHDSPEVKELAAEYVRSGALTGNHINDCLHIAYAVVNECDTILSWNFDHTREWTRGRINEVNAASRYRGAWIASPGEFLKGGYR
jgi:predicted nucleic acid-binding protein